MSVNGCLRAAADRLDTKGWNQGAYGISSKGTGHLVRTGGGGRILVHKPSPKFPRNIEEETPVTTCVVGAIRCCAADDEEGDKAKAKLAAHLGVDNLSTWNDEPGRTREEVSAALRAVAK